MESRAQIVLGELERQGLHGRMVDIRHLEDLRNGIEGWRQQGLLDDEFYQVELTGFRFQAPEALPEPRCLIVVARPQPQLRLDFAWQGRVVPAILPPTYVWRGPDRELEELLAGALAPEGYRVAKAIVPVKLLAVRSGLGRYGRNNVCYVEGLGSFHRLAAFFSDLPCGEDSWQEPAMLERCEHCTACRRQCPTGAIAEERFLLHAERCLTFHNERAPAFPAWIDPGWHHCIVGCMQCQRACPENKAVVGWVEEGARFSEEETALLLEGTPAERLPRETAAKLERLDLFDALDVLPRNLRALIRATEEAHGR